MTILQDLEAARDALAGVKAMLPSDAPELPDTERISGSFIYLRWQELREVKAALSRLRARLEQVDAEPPFGWLFESRKGMRQFIKGTDFCKPVLELHRAMVAENPGEYTMTTVYTSPTPAAAPEFDSAPQVSRNPQTGIKPAVDVEGLELPPMPEPALTAQGMPKEFLRCWSESQMRDYARAALRMHLTGGK